MVVRDTFGAMFHQIFTKILRRGVTILICANHKIKVASDLVTSVHPK